MWNSYYVKTRVISDSEKSWNYINFKIEKFPVGQLRECPGITNIGRTLFEMTYRNATKYRVSIKSFPDYKNLLQENYCTWNTNFLFSKCNSRSFFFYNILEFVQNLNYCTLSYTKLVWGTTHWFTRTALKCFTHGINSLITHTGPAASVKVTNTVSLYVLWIPRFDAFNIWRRSSILISEFPLHWDRWICFVIPQNTLSFLLYWRHFDASRLCTCNTTIRNFLVVSVCSQGKTLCSLCRNRPKQEGVVDNN